MKYILLHVFILSYSFIISQTVDNKRDYNWVFGRGGSSYRNMLSFHTTPPTLTNITPNIGFLDMGACINDTSGNFLFSTNGFKVMNKNQALMENGDSLNCCLGYFNQGMQTGYGALQGVLILPKPNNNSIYYVFHTNADITSSAPYFQYTSVLYYSIVDMSYNSGLGKVVQKNIPIMLDTLNGGMVDACRHANGRDWWMLIREYASNRYHRFLISPQGIQEIGIQTIGSPIPQYSYGQTIFSPDGTKFAMAQSNQANNLLLHYSLYDFDRCTGLLSNHVTDTLPNYASFCGIAFSPNSHYLYISAADTLYQFDMQNSDWQATKQIAAYHLPWVDSIGITYTFGFMVPAPDGKIYVYGGNSSYYLNVINSPDSAGTACNFTHHSFPLTTYNGRCMPNFPHFRLGALIGSGCDTLLHVGIIKQDDITHDIQVYPNPTDNVIQIQQMDNRKGNGNIEIRDSYNRFMLSKSIAEEENAWEINTSSLASGVYLLTINRSGQDLYVQKVIIIR